MIEAFSLLNPLFDSFQLLATSSLGEAASGAAHESTKHEMSYILTLVGIALFLVILNGFFVAAEFALVKVRVSQIDKMVAEKKMFAKTAKWTLQRLDHSLSCCQLGITMASLALGIVGEPAFHHLIEPVFAKMGVTSPALLHGISLTLSFSVMTVLHLVIGEQVPKIFAIRRPEQMVRWCALPMKFFYFLLFPFMYMLNWATEIVLGWLGLTGSTGHDTPHTEEEIRALLREAHIHGQLNDSEHELINKVFEFDDLYCRLAMLPRGEVRIFDINKPFPELLALAQETKHTRYPVCDGSLDNLLGVVHMKDLLGIAHDRKDFDLTKIMRKPVKVPEKMPISKVLKTIQETHQLLTFVIDEYGTVIGIITLENVLEKIIGPVDDEFDQDKPEIQQLNDGSFMVLGSTPISAVEKALNLQLDDMDVDTVAGVLMSRMDKLPDVGDRYEFEGATAEVVEVKHDHAEAIRFDMTEVSPPTKDEQESSHH